jgi:hypothetical protein
MSAYVTVTLTQFIANVRTNLGPAAFWTDDEIRQFINAGLRCWNSLTGFWSSSQNVPLVADHPYYALNGTLVFGARVELDGAVLQAGTVFGWDQQDPHWMSMRGRPEAWAPVGLGIIAVNPLPPSGGSILTVFGISVTPVLVNPGDFINLGQEDFNALSNYVTHTLQIKSGGAEFQSSMEDYKAFIQAAGVRCEKLRASTFYKRVMGLEADKQLKRMRAAVNAITADASNAVGMR